MDCLVQVWRLHTKVLGYINLLKVNSKVSYHVNVTELYIYGGKLKRMGNSLLLRFNVQQRIVLVDYS